MNPDLFRSFVAPAFASIFLVLTMCALIVRSPSSTGYYVPMAQIHHDPNEPTDCGGRSEFIRLTNDGRSWINDAEVPAERIGAAVAQVMDDRAEKVVYIVVDSNLSYGQFAQFVDRVTGAGPDIHIVLISGAVRRDFEKNHDLCNFHYSPYR